MTIAIRTDASSVIGCGHVMRCLTLAHALREAGGDVFFICRDLPGNLGELIQDKGFVVHLLPNQEKKETKESPPSGSSHRHWLGVDWQTDVRQTIEILSECKTSIDWLIVDHYAIDRTWEMEAKPYVRKIMVIDDLADRPHDCHLLLDQNFYHDAEERYNGLIPDSCVTLLGPRYALLKDVFARAAASPCERKGQLRRLFVFFGGSDPTNETAKTLEAIQCLGIPEIDVDVVMGINHSRKAEIKIMAAAMPQVHLHCQVENMVSFMTKADLAVGAGGITTWERCCVGLPAVVITLAFNQVRPIQDLADYGCICLLGESKDVTTSRIAETIRCFMDNPERLREYSTKAISLVDGQGTKRCIDTLLQLL